MSRTLLAMWVLILGCSCLQSIVRGDEPEQSDFNVFVVSDEESAATTEKAPEKAARLELVGSANFGWVDLGAEPPSKYWIGLGCELATDALKSQLGLTEKQALLVTMVADESPAKAAGFQVHDVITTVKFGEESKPLDSIATLTTMVAQAEANPLVLSVIRQGKPQDITVTPAERPQPKQDVLSSTNPLLNLATTPAPWVSTSDPERVQRLLRELQAAVGGQSQPTTIHFTGPVVAPSVPAPPPGIPHIVVMSKPELPENVTITITKTGKEPIRIKYQTGENNSWGATEKELSTLPAEGRTALQTVVTTLQQANPHSFVNSIPNPTVTHWPVRTVYRTEAIQGRGFVTGAGITGVVTTQAAPTKPPTPEDAAARLKALEENMERLQKQQQDLMTKQQEALKKELQALREALETIEKK